MGQKTPWENTNMTTENNKKDAPEKNMFWINACKNKEWALCSIEGKKYIASMPKLREFADGKINGVFFQEVENYNKQ